MKQKTAAAVRITGLEEVMRELDRRGANVQSELANAMELGGNVIAEAAKANAAPVSKAIAMHVRVKVTIKKNKVEVQVGSTSPLSHLHEYGVKAHPITPRERKALLIDRSKFAGSAKHPGMGASPWLRPAFDSRKQAAQDAIRQKLAEALQR